MVGGRWRWVSEAAYSMWHVRARAPGADVRGAWVCGVRYGVCGMRYAECGVRYAECGVQSAECGVRCAVCMGGRGDGDGDGGR
jgi:hypothetical protein